MTGMKVGEPVMRQAAESGRSSTSPRNARSRAITSCRGWSGSTRAGHAQAAPRYHPIELMAMSYGIDG